MSDNHMPSNSSAVTNTAVPSPAATDKSVSNAFWSTLEHIIRPQAAVRTSSTAMTTNTTPAMSSNDNISLAERYTLRLNDLKSTEPIHSRLKTFEELIKLNELFNLNETFINTLLESTRDLFRINNTPIEYRRQAFEYLIQLYQKQSERFETLLLKNHLLTIIILDNSALTPSNCLFLRLFGPILTNFHNESPLAIKPSHTPVTNCDDIKHRFILFTAITKNGTSCKHLDQKLTTECLSTFLRYANGLTAESNKQVFDLFKNIIQNQFFHLLDESLVLQLTKYVLNFSYEILKQTNAHHHHLNKQQQTEIKSCIDLCEKLSPNLLSIETVTHIIIVLCELLDVNTQKSIDIQLCTQIYECMNALLNGTLGHANLFSFFTQIFPANNKLQTHRLHQLNGGLMHIRQLFDDFKQTKMKNTFLIKELHLNCLVYLPTALKTCCSEQQLVLFENILTLTLDLVHLATHRDLFMCLLTFNSRKFLIEIIDQFSTQINTENNRLIQKYADLLNLLDKKDVFNYKTSSTSGSSDDSMAVVLQKFKENFHELVYKFPYISYLSDSCINNCVEYYLYRKLLLSHGKHSIKGISQLIEKYFLIKNNKNCQVRKNVIDAVCRKLFDYNKDEYKTFIDDVIQQALLPCIEQSIEDDNKYYHSMDADSTLSASMHSDLIEMKSFFISKLVEIAHICRYEENVLKIIEILTHIINIEKTSNIDILNIQNTIISTTASITPINKTSAILSPTPTSATPQPINNNNQNYLYRTIIALIDLFERHHYDSSHCMTRCCARIYLILVDYLDNYYDLTHANKPLSFTLSSIAAESIAFQQQQQNAQYRGSISLSTAIEIQPPPKNFNYYAQIRREIFDFLFRIRSDKDNRVHLINRNDRKKHTDSRYLVLALDKNFELKEEYTLICVLDYGRFLNLIEYCLEKELDWNVLIKVLNELPLVLQYQMNLVRNSDFVQNIFKMLHKREINTFKNRPESLTRPDYICKFYPLIASLILYHQILERSSQEIILQNFSIGISSSRSRFCLETLTIAMTEMHETNAKQCAEILLKLSQFSPSQNMAQPVLELLSTISDLKKLDSTIFGRKEFIAVSAIAIKYTDPLKFNPFIILLAHYVICIWFIKCKQDFRKNYASFTCKGLYQEVIVQLDRLNKSKKDSKSPNRQVSEENALKQRSMTVSALPINLPSSNQLVTLDDSAKSSQQTKANLTESMKIFYRELVEITLDFMSNNMFFDNTQQLGCNNGQREFLVDIYSNASMAASANSTLRNNSLIDNSTVSALSSTNATSSAMGNRSNNIQSRSWICGNKIIQIKTGLFSNICIEEPNSNLSRKQRVNSLTNNKKTVSTLTPQSSQNSTSSKLAPSLAINIPNQPANNKSSDTKKSILQNATQTGANDSFASSESSTNNSFNLAKQMSEKEFGEMISQTRKSSLLTTDSDHGKQGDEASLSAKSDQDYFEEAIEAINDGTAAQPTTISQENKESANIVNRSKLNSSAGGLTRRNNLMKRRYKSGIPLSSNERSDDDLVDEIYLRQYNESSANKQSKDDSDLSLASSLCCLKNASSVDEMKPPTDCLYHSDYAKHLKNETNLQLSSATISQSSHTHRSQRNSGSGSSQRNHSSKNYTDNTSIDSRRQTNDATDTNKEMCLSSCWCNNLVEITCRYPTKVVTYVALIESNNCTNHELNLSLIEMQQQQQRLNQSKEIKNLIKTTETSQSELFTSIDNSNESTLTPSMIANAVELRRNASLTRISESSVSQQEMSSANSNNSLESASKDEVIEHNQSFKTINLQQSSSLAKAAVLKQTAASHITSNLLNKSFYENEFVYQRPALMRKASFDSSAGMNSNIIAAAAARIPYHDIPSSSSSNRKQISIISNPSNINSSEQTSSSPNNSIVQSAFNPSNTSINSVQSRQTATTTPSIDPSEVFLHLFQQTTQPYSTSSEYKDQQPMMIPENSASQRSMNILDYLPCYLIHKIGVVYVGRNQAHDEKAILSNASGSQRYKNFINGLGQLIRLKDLDTNRYYSGGLETDGSAGEFTLLWFDGIIQVVFHVATMMPLREDNYNAKKKHIGNDSTIIVYNESGEEYQFNMIKGEVNCVCIEIEPMSNSNTNLIRVKTTNELTQSSWIIHQEQKYVSDQNLAIVTRKIALHADIASRCYRFQKDNNGTNPYGGKWYERLKQINRIRKTCKEFYAKQQPVKSGANTATMSSTTNQANNNTNTTSNSQNNVDIQFDFTEYI